MWLLLGAVAAQASGELCVYSPRRATALLVRIRIEEFGEVVAAVGPGRYRCWRANAGFHRLTTRGERWAEWDFQVAEGATTWVEARLRAGWLTGRPRLALSSQAAFEAPLRPYLSSDWVPTDER